MSAEVRLTVRLPEIYDTERVTAVDEQLARRCEGCLDSLPGPLAGARMSAVEGSDPYREGQIEGWFVGEKLEVLRGRTAHAEPTGGDIHSGRPFDEGDALGRAVDDQDVSVGDPLRHGLGSGAGCATDLQHSNSGTQRQRVHDGREAVGQSSIGHRLKA